MANGWTRDKPKVAGWYFYRYDDKIQHSCFLTEVGEGTWAENLTAEWYGPIEVPNE